MPDPHCTHPPQTLALWRSLGMSLGAWAWMGCSAGARSLASWLRLGLVVGTLLGLSGAALALEPVAPDRPAASTQAQHGRTLTLGVFAFRPKPIMEERFAPLGHYLSQALPGLHVQVVPLSNEELETALINQKVDFVLTNPTHFVKLREHGSLSGALATMVMRQGDLAVHGIGGVIVRRADRTDLQQLTDLSKRRIAIAGKHYLGTYMAPAAELVAAGVNLDGIEWVETLQPVDQVITSVLERRADAGFVRTGVLEDMEREGKLAPGALAVINPVSHPNFMFRASTRLYPEWPLVAVSHVDPAISQQVAHELMALRPGDAAAKAAQIYGFTIPADYAPVEQAMRNVRMEPFDRVPELNLADVWNRFSVWIAVVGTVSVLAMLLTMGLVLQRRRLLLTQATLQTHQRELSEATERLSYLMESSPVMFYTLAVNGPHTRPTWVGGNIRRLIGYTPEQAMNPAWWRTHLHPDDYAAAAQTMRKLHQARELRHSFRFRLTDGSYRWFEDEVRVLGQRHGETEALGIWRDITTAKQQEDSLHLAASVFNNSYDGIIITDRHQHIVNTNPAFSRITGIPRAHALGQRLESLAGATDANAATEPGVLHHMPDILASQGHWQGEVVLRRHWGPGVVCAMSATAVQDSHADTAHHVIVFSDISHIKAHQAELDRLAYFDPLTGVPNRRLLADRLNQAVERARRTDLSLAVCYLDLDDFKPVNDRLGHAMGDQLLIQVTSRLQAILRGNDTLARLGGDEFVLLLTDLAQPTEWQLVLERVLAAVQQPVALGNEHVVVSVSVGVTVYPADQSDADSLLRHADQAMYRAKQAGRNRYHLFDMAQDREVQAQREQQLRLAAALADNELVLFYQPKVDLETGAVVGAEALMRWRHPERGLLPPGEFLWQAADSELEIDLGEWVICTALHQLDQWQHTPGSLPDDLCISVNLSGHQLLKPGFFNFLQRSLAEHPGVDPHHLELEILESAAIADMATAAHVMTQCRALGVRFALDDFGTGYSSLAYFRTLPVDVIKIDQSFVRDMLQDADDHGIVQSVVYLAHAFHRPVIAEGVETLAHAAALLRLGCHLGQGYGIARPMPAEQLQAWAADWQHQQLWRSLRSAIV